MTIQKPILGLAALLTLLTLQACGGGGSSNTDFAAETAVAGGNSVGSARPSAAAASANSVTDSAALSCGLNQPSGIEAEILSRVNNLRANGAVCGSTAFGPAPALAWNRELLKAAGDHSSDMAENNYFSHTSLDGRTPPKRLIAAGYDYSTMGENIAAGQPGVEAAVSAWLNSPDHCKNLMNPVFREVAVACVANPNSTYVRYWSMELGRKF